MHITILGQQQPITLPGFAAREELSTVVHEHWKAPTESFDPLVLRSFAACIGLCTPVGRASKESYQAHRFDVLSYGGAVYDWLRSHGSTPNEVIDAGATIIGAVREDLYPRAEEVEEALGNSGPGGSLPPPPGADAPRSTEAPPTVPPSA